MILDEVTAVGSAGTAIETVLAACQTNEVLKAIQIVLSIITFLVTLAYTVWKWYKKATDDKSDGGKKITKDEVDDLFKQIDDLNKENEENDKH